MLFEPPQRRNSHNTLVPTKLSGRPKVRMSDASTFQPTELSFFVVIARTSGQSVACRMPLASWDSTRVAILGRSLWASTLAPWLEKTRVLCLSVMLFPGSFIQATCVGLPQIISLTKKYQTV